MQSRCCWPPLSDVPAWSSLSFTSSHRAARLRALSTLSRNSVPFRRPVIVSPMATLSKILLDTSGLGLWKTMPTARRTSVAPAFA